MKLIKPREHPILEMMEWFTNKRELNDWAGPDFNYPFDQTSFTRDLTLGTLDSMCLISTDDNLLGFGQCYLRAGRCHLGRIAVSPEHRGRGVVSNLLDLLANFGIKKLVVTELSLFVLPGNQSVISAYLKYGFKLTEYPETMAFENCLYMVKSAYTLS